jgi:hypothetical protein
LKTALGCWQGVVGWVKLASLIAPTTKNDNGIGTSTVLVGL